MNDTGFPATRYNLSRLTTQQHISFEKLAVFQVFLQLQEAELTQMKGLKASLQKARELKQSESEGNEGRGFGGAGSMEKNGLIMELYQKCALIKARAKPYCLNIRGVAYLTLHQPEKMLRTHPRNGWFENVSRGCFLTVNQGDICTEQPHIPKQGVDGLIGSCQCESDTDSLCV